MTNKRLTIILSLVLFLFLSVTLIQHFSNDDLEKNAQVEFIELQLCAEDYFYVDENNHLQIPKGTKELKFCGTLSTYRPISLMAYVYKENSHSIPTIVYDELGDFQNGSVEIKLTGIEKLDAGRYEFQIYFGRYMLYESIFFVY